MAKRKANKNNRQKRKISANGVNLIKRFEGLRLEAYLDDGYKIPTIGYGTTRINNRTVPMGLTISEAQAEKYLKDDLEKFEKIVNEQVGVSLTQNQFDALVSFTYNLGGHNLASSTLLKKLNSGDYEGAANEFSRWVFANGIKLRGLERRRKAEKEMFLKEDEESGFTFEFINDIVEAVSDMFGDNEDDKCE